MDVIKPWITARVNDILGMEDDVVVEYILSQIDDKNLNPKLLQVNCSEKPCENRIFDRKIDF